MARDLAMDRRRLLALMGGSAGAVLLPGGAAAQTGAAAAPARPRFFTAQEFALLDEIAEMIIPADSKSGGARAAKVAEYIDARVAESVDPLFKSGWREDLAEIDRISLEMFGRRFVAARPADRVRLMDRISRNEASPRQTGEYTFGTIKWQVTFCYYKTRIGIHDDLDYKGNQVLDAFEGLEPWKT